MALYQIWRVRTPQSIINYKNENRLGITATANCKKKKNNGEKVEKQLENNN